MDQTNAGGQEEARKGKGGGPGSPARQGRAVRAEPGLRRGGPLGWGASKHQVPTRTVPANDLGRLAPSPPPSIAGGLVGFRGRRGGGSGLGILRVEGLLRFRGLWLWQLRRVPSNSSEACLFGLSGFTGRGLVGFVGF